MASMLPLSSPFLFCNSFRRQTNTVAFKKLSYSTRSNHRDETTTEIPMRRSANYPPSLWSYDFIQSLSSKYSEDRYMTRSGSLKEKVRTMIHQGNEMVETPLSMLNLIDDLQRLGISYHFTNEISNVLDKIYSNCYKSHKEWSKMDLNLKSLGFRLLRQHGYAIPQEIFKDNIDENGAAKGHLSEDIISMLNLYEASYHSLEDESLLDGARIFTEKYLKESIEHIADKTSVSLISRALVFPLHWTLPRLNTKWFIEVYERRHSMNPMVLELSKLDFNMVQAIYQEDLKQTSRWWKETCWEKFGFARDRVMENFMWAAAHNHLPHFKGRRDLTKVYAMLTTIDDVYDVYGTLEELEKFTDAVNSWDLKAIEELPNYMQICFLAVYNTVNEMSYNVLTNEGLYVLHYLKKAWQDQCNAFMIEARWFASGYTPPFNEFLNNAYMSIAGVTIIKYAYLLTLTGVSEGTLAQIGRAENMIRYACLITRLTNDMGTSSDEQERGDAPKSIQCYMHESGATEVETREYMKNLLVETWQKLNQERQAIGSELSYEFIECITNFARTSHFMYHEGDKHDGLQSSPLLTHEQKLKWKSDNDEQILKLVTERGTGRGRGRARRKSSRGRVRGRSRTDFDRSTVQNGSFDYEANVQRAVNCAEFDEGKTCSSFIKM